MKTKLYHPVLFVLAALAVVASGCGAGSAAGVPQAPAAPATSAPAAQATPAPPQSPPTAAVPAAGESGAAPPAVSSVAAPPATSMPAAVATATRPAATKPAAPPAPTATATVNPDLKAELFFPGAGGPNDCNLQGSQSGATVQVKYRPDKNNQIQASGTDLPQSKKLPLGVYFSKKRDGKTNLIFSQTVQTNGQGKFSIGLPVKASDRKGFYFVIVVADRKGDYMTDGGQTDFQGAGGCFQVK